MNPCLAHSYFWIVTERAFVDTNAAIQRITYNTRHFSGNHHVPFASIASLTFAPLGNYLLIVAILGVYSLLTNRSLLLALTFLIGGFIAINKWGGYFYKCRAVTIMTNTV